MINRKFLNFKTYRNFAEKKAEIPEDSIVFIQDKACIWARGKEYICEGPIVTSVKDGTLTFKHGDDKIAFKFSQEIDSKEGTGKVTVEDSEGNKSSATYVLSGTFDQFVTNINSYFDQWQDTTDDFALKAELADVAFTGNYNDLSNTPNPLVIDSIIDDTDNAVKNRAINAALKLKANTTDLDAINRKFGDYLTNTEYQTEKRDYIQEKFSVDSGLQFYRDSISNKLRLKTEIDSGLFIIVNSLEGFTPDPNKIYLLEAANGDGTYRYEQWRYKNGQWVQYAALLPEIEITGYETEQNAKDSHDAIWNFINKLRSDFDALDFSDFASKELDILPITTILPTFATMDWVDQYYQPRDDYATKNWVETYFVQKTKVYYPKIGEWGTNDQTDGGSVVTPVIQQITVDNALSLSSPNPVENSVITQYVYGLANSKAEQSALDALNYTLTHDYATKTDISSKVESSTLANYATLDDLADGLDTKQDTLIPVVGGGIKIINNRISIDRDSLDTRVFIFVTGQLPSTEIYDDKIYILETIDPNDDSRTYTQWRHDSNAAEPWILIGSVTPETSFEGYLTAEQISNLYLSQQDARSLYQPKANDYARTSDISDLQDQIDDLEDYVDDTFQVKGQYATQSQLSTQIDNVKGWAEARFQRTGGYALASDVSAAFTTLQSIIDQKYVLKRDVYNPTDFNGWSTTTPSSINISPSAGGGTPGESGGGSSAGANMMTLTVEQYEYLVSTDAVNENTYYFTYEEEEETWTFGGTFPITLT